MCGGFLYTTDLDWWPEFLVRAARLDFAAVDTTAKTLDRFIAAEDFSRLSFIFKIWLCHRTSVAGWRGGGAHIPQEDDTRYCLWAGFYRWIWGGQSSKLHFRVETVLSFRIQFFWQSSIRNCIAYILCDCSALINESEIFNSYLAAHWTVETHCPKHDRLQRTLVMQHPSLPAAQNWHRG